MNPPTTQDSAHLDRLIARLGELESLLDREYQAIRQRDLVELDSLARDKQTHVDGINLIVANLGGTFETLFSDKSSIAGNQLRTLITRCGQANKTNGCAIESVQSFTTALLDVLHGRIPGERTYTAYGRLGASRATAGAFVRV